jgi:hypothetical protein
MARRIALTMLALVSALLITAVVPLGVLATSHEGSSFREDTVLTAHAFAAVAEDGLSEHTPNPAMASFLARAGRGEEGWVYDAAGRLVAQVGPRSAAIGAAGPGGKAAGIAASTVLAVLHHGGTVVSQAQGLMWVAAPVDVASRRPLGVVVIARSNEELNERLRVLWSWLVAIAAIGLVAGAVVALWVARWVGRVPCRLWMPPLHSSAGVRWGPGR